VGNLARPYWRLRAARIPASIPLRDRQKTTALQPTFKYGDRRRLPITFKIRRHNQPNAAHAQFWSELNRSRSNQNALSHSPGLRTGHSCRTNRAMAALSLSGEGPRRDVSLATVAAAGMVITMVEFVGVPAWRIVDFFPITWSSTARGVFVISGLQSWHCLRYSTLVSV
jgi:hypothetical protein